MLFPEEDAPLLKAWIVKRIENTSDADAEVLAEYVIALLKHDGDKKSVRQLCEDEIPDFLSEDPKAFLDDVFQAIAYKSYLPGAAPPPKLPPPGAVQVVQAPKPPAGPKKRGYHDLDAPGSQEAHSNGPRPMKNPRRNGPGRANVDISQQQADTTPRSLPPPFDSPNPIPMEAFMAFGMPFPGTMPQLGPSGGGSRGGRPRRKGRCRDFDTKGYCSRGSSCPYDHGNESAYIPPMIHQAGEYNPQDPLVTLSSLQNYMNALTPTFESNRGRGNRRGGRGGKKGGSRAAFSADGPVYDRSKSTIVIENIPEESFSEEEVRGFFSQFGDITEVTMQPYKHLAIVKYEKWGSANAAYKSPKVIFDNRFVKVFWYKDDSDAGKTPSANGTKSSNEQAKSESMDTEPDMDPEEFKRKQEEAQKQFQQREDKRAELERQKQELEKKQQELRDKHREETVRLQSKLLEKTGGNGDAATPATGTDALRAKLADLEREAKILGIDPDAGEDATIVFSARGGGYRGRGSFRSRGRGAWRGGRAGFGSGGVDGRHAAYAQYSIDNRPKRLAITGVDFSAPDKDESLRHFLLNLGEFESVEPSPSTTYVSFQDRKTAEKLYYMLNGKELPGVEGTLDLQWVSNTASSSATPRPAALVITKDVEEGEEQEEDEDRDNDDAMGDDENGQSGTVGQQQRQRQQQRQQQQDQAEMDYERPEDDDDAY